MVEPTFGLAAAAPPSPAPPPAEVASAEGASAAASSAPPTAAVASSPVAAAASLAPAASPSPAPSSRSPVAAAPSSSFSTSPSASASASLGTLAFESLSSPSSDATEPDSEAPAESSATASSPPQSEPPSPPPRDASARPPAAPEPPAEPPVSRPNLCVRWLKSYTAAEPSSYRTSCMSSSGRYWMIVPEYHTCEPAFIQRTLIRRWTAASPAPAPAFRPTRPDAEPLPPGQLDSPAPAASAPRNRVNNLYGASGRNTPLSLRIRLMRSCSSARAAFSSTSCASRSFCRVNSACSACLASLLAARSSITPNHCFDSSRRFHSSSA
mmetsp:Transcript_168669/g.409980  ORF Transcript_168669/g.409980 Transcript_168669/m.409980 type:complete len:325 (-) Transcript_168669:4250-5224(-)